jgi:hypothetical protein
MLTILSTALVSVAPPAAQGAETNGIPDLGTRRELFVDRFLIEAMDEGLSLKMGALQPAPNSPKPALRGHYSTILRDGDLFRQYCRKDGVAEAIEYAKGKTFKKPNDAHFIVRHHLFEATLYAESKDGIQWTKPDLGLYPKEKDKNVVLANEPPACHNFTPFIDTRPGVPPEERYKAVGGHSVLASEWLKRHYGEENYNLAATLPCGLAYFASADGLHWKRIKTDAITLPKRWDKGFDSQNVAFWSEAEGQYVCYFRIFPLKDKMIRGAARTTSKDFLTWTDPVEMKGRLEGEEWYTTGTHPYSRAPHIYIAPATRFIEGGDKGPDKTNTRVLLMTTRAGSDAYDRTFGQQDFLSVPSTGNRRNYIAWGGGTQTGPKELSFYNIGERHTLRLDGFGSLHAGEQAGTMTTRPFTFGGKALELNFVVQEGGFLRVELQGADGAAIGGCGLEDCPKIEGDSVDHVMAWKGGKDLSALAGKVVRLRVELRNADLYAFRFLPEIPAPPPPAAERAAGNPPENVYASEEAWNAAVVTLMGTNIAGQAAFAFQADRPELPNVLLIGDSISIGYTPLVRRALKDAADVYRIPENGFTSRWGLERLEAWLGGVKWDAIHFNWGLHDCFGEAKPRTTPEDYASNLEKIVGRLKTAAPGARLIFALTTPVPEESKWSEPGKETVYNEAARKALAAFPDVVINDLHEVATPHSQKGNVHFGGKGYQALGDHVTGAIREALKIGEPG